MHRMWMRLCRPHPEPRSAIATRISHAVINVSNDVKHVVLVAGDDEHAISPISEPFPFVLSVKNH